MKVKVLSVVRFSFKLFIALISILLFISNVEANSNEIYIGMSAAFKGPTGGLGSELYRGSMAYINYINDNGGINGKKIIIIPYDDGYNPTPAIENTIKLIEKDNVFLLFDYLGTPTVTRVLPLLRVIATEIYTYFSLLQVQNLTDNHHMINMSLISGHLIFRRPKVLLIILSK